MVAEQVESRRLLTPMLNVREEFPNGAGQCRGFDRLLHLVRLQTRAGRSLLPRMRRDPSRHTDPAGHPAVPATTHPAVRKLPSVTIPIRQRLSAAGAAHIGLSAAITHWRWLRPNDRRYGY